MFGKKLSARDEKAPFNLEMGVESCDVVSGFRGKIVGVTRWLTGCDQYALQPPINDKGELPEMKWFDESRLTGVAALANGGDTGNCPKPTSR